MRRFSHRASRTDTLFALLPNPLTRVDLVPPPVTPRPTPPAGGPAEPPAPDRPAAVERKTAPKP